MKFINYTYKPEKEIGWLRWEDGKWTGDAFGLRGVGALERGIFSTPKPVDTNNPQEVFYWLQIVLNNPACVAVPEKGDEEATTMKSELARGQRADYYRQKESSIKKTWVAGRQQTLAAHLEAAQSHFDTMKSTDRLREKQYHYSVSERHIQKAVRLGWDAATAEAMRGLLRGELAKGARRPGTVAVYAEQPPRSEQFDSGRIVRLTRGEARALVDRVKELMKHARRSGVVYKARLELLAEGERFLRVADDLKHRRWKRARAEFGRWPERAQKSFLNLFTDKASVGRLAASLGVSLKKDGTTEGALKGWETRRGEAGADSPQLDETAKAIYDKAAAQDAEPKDKKRIADMARKAWEKAGAGLDKLDVNVFAGKMQDLAVQMANAITDPGKACRRAKAAEDENYHDIAAVFYQRARQLAAAHVPVRKALTLIEKAQDRAEDKAEEQMLCAN